MKYRVSLSLVAAEANETEFESPGYRFCSSQCAAVETQYNNLRMQRKWLENRAKEWLLR